MSRVLDSPRKFFSDEDDGHQRKHFRRHRGDGREVSKLDGDIKGRKSTYRDYHSVKHRETCNDDLSDGSSDGHGKKRSSRSRREPESTRQDSKSRKVQSLSSKDESTKGRASDRYAERASKSSSRHRSVAYSVHNRHKTKNWGQRDSSYADKHHDKLHKKEEAGSSINDSYGDSPDSKEDSHHRHSRKDLRKVNIDEESSSASEKSGHTKRKERVRSKDKTYTSEIKYNGDSRDTCGSRQHRCAEKSSKEMKIISGSTDGGGRLGKDKKKPQKDDRKSKRKRHSGFTDTESDKDEDMRHIHSKTHSKKVKIDAESSDDTFYKDTLISSKNRSQKSRRYCAKNESDMERYRGSNDEGPGHHGHRRRVYHPGLSKDDSIRRDEECITSEEMETCAALSSCQDCGETEAELEKACRQAALMKFEEIRKNKDTQVTHSKDPIESSSMCAHENIVGKGVVLEKCGSNKFETSVASTISWNMRSVIFPSIHLFNLSPGLQVPTMS